MILPMTPVLIEPESLTRPNPVPVSSSCCCCCFFFLFITKFDSFLPISLHLRSPPLFIFTFVSINTTTLSFIRPNFVASRCVSVTAAWPLVVE
ncbi:hypothetical protein L6452_04544 [Arctium lappa]|uniref:Uncharacterized protein n=1 Tax=Arctium lappa TaxID=4217 RepID=A0ACB9EE69_ARCLA|nr:hypothetical protein L6452_04544 [Arctium lappa]